MADATEGKDKVKATVNSGMKDLLVLKTAGSSFEDFYKDEFTTLAGKRGPDSDTKHRC